MDKNFWNDLEMKPEPTKEQSLKPVIPVAITPVSKEFGISNYFAGRANREIVKDAMHEATGEQCRAILAKCALDNVRCPFSYRSKSMYDYAKCGDALQVYC